LETQELPRLPFGRPSLMPVLSEDSLLSAKCLIQRLYLQTSFSDAWKDGVLSVIMRDMNKCQGKFKQEHLYKWIILDGDVDPEWIESCNTVMDDNKVLTLVSQERIPLTPSMRLILEVSHLKNATPATVSRGGVLFINDADVGWKPFFESWILKYKNSDDEFAENVFTLTSLQFVTCSRFSQWLALLISCTGDLPRLRLSTT
jgi:hypothetical protein